MLTDNIHLLKAALLGLIEGATEFIPVSSTGHLVIAQNLINFTGRKENAFMIFIQLGAILAVVWIYRKKIIYIITGLKSVPEARLTALNVIIGTIPAVVIGLPTEAWIETHFFKPVPVSLALILGGIAIFIIERRLKDVEITDMDHIPVKKAFGIGVVQVLSILFPGVSRSGATIMGGLIFGLSRRASAEFSFFLAMPAMLGASLIKLIGVADTFAIGDVPVFATGFIVSFISAFFVIRGLLAFISRSSFIPFAWYRIIFGTGVLLLSLYSGGIF